VIVREHLAAFLLVSLPQNWQRSVELPLTQLSSGRLIGLWVYYSAL